MMLCVSRKDCDASISSRELCTCRPRRQNRCCAASRARIMLPHTKHFTKRSVLWCIESSSKSSEYSSPLDLDKLSAGNSTGLCIGSGTVIRSGKRVSLFVSLGSTASALRSVMSSCNSRSSKVSDWSGSGRGTLGSSCCGGATCCVGTGRCLALHKNIGGGW